MLAPWRPREGHARSFMADLWAVGGEIGERKELAERVAREGSLRELTRVLQGPVEERWSRIEGMLLLRRLRRWSTEPLESMFWRAGARFVALGRQRSWRAAFSAPLATRGVH